MDNKPTYAVDNLVTILGTDDIIWMITGVKQDTKYEYLYTLKKTEGDTPLDKLDWCPQCLLVKYEYSE